MIIWDYFSTSFWKCPQEILVPLPCSGSLITTCIRSVFKVSCFWSLFAYTPEWPCSQQLKQSCKCWLPSSLHWSLIRKMPLPHVGTLSRYMMRTFFISWCDVTDYDCSKIIAHSSCYLVTHWNESSAIVISVISKSS